MQVSTKAIVLTSLKYGETSLIVKAFTEVSGVKSYMLKGILSSKKGKLKTSYFQPLTILDMEAVHKNKGGLERIQEAKIAHFYTSIHSNIAKNAMAMFLAEMLSNSIHEEEANTELFLFIETSFQWLDANHDISNFHIYFLLSITKYLGFYPDRSNINSIYFDLLEGAFTNTPSLNPIISGENLTCFKMLLGTNFDSVHTIKLNKRNRQELLKSLVLYFELHLQGFRKPKSLAILNEVFN